MQGVLFENGYGVPRDLKKAELCYQKAAKTGNAKAQANLGILYSNENSSESNPILAYLWLKLSADQGEITALNFLKEYAASLSDDQRSKAEKMIKEYRATAQP